jgi:hypothetical protein
MEAQGRILLRDWDLYDTRHVVFRPARLRAEALEAGYWRAYREFYQWRNIARGAATKPTVTGALRHAAYAAGWKKFEPLWDWLIRARRVGRALPILETVLEGFARWRHRAAESDEGPEDLVRHEHAVVGQAEDVALERDQLRPEGVAQGGHGTGSASAGRATSATLLALR